MKQTSTHPAEKVLLFFVPVAAAVSSFPSGKSFVIYKDYRGHAPAHCICISYTGTISPSWCIPGVIMELSNRHAPFRERR